MAETNATATERRLPREFRFNGARLADPDANMTADEVRKRYSSAGYPTLTNASIVGPEEINGRSVYTFKQAVGTKG